MGGQCHSTLGNACYPKRAEALDFRIVCLHFLMQLAHPRQGVASTAASWRASPPFWKPTWGAAGSRALAT